MPDGLLGRPHYRVARDGRAPHHIRYLRVFPAPFSLLRLGLSDSSDLEIDWAYFGAFEAL